MRSTPVWAARQGLLAVTEAGVDTAEGAEEPRVVRALLELPRELSQGDLVARPRAVPIALQPQGVSHDARQRHVGPLRGEDLDAERVDTRDGLVVATLEKVELDEPLRQRVGLEQVRGRGRLCEQRSRLADVPVLAEVNAGTIGVLARPPRAQRQSPAEATVGLRVSPEEPVRLGEVVPFLGTARVDGHDTLVESRRLFNLPRAPVHRSLQEDGGGVIGTQLERGPRLSQRTLVVEVSHVVVVAKGEAGFRDVGGESHRTLGRETRPFQAGLGAVLIEPAGHQVPPRQCGVSFGEPGVAAHCLRQEAQGLRVLLGVVAARGNPVRPQVQVVGGQVLRGDSPDRARLLRRQGLPQRAHDLGGHVGLEGEHVGHLPFVAARPEVGVVAHPDELGRDPHATRPGVRAVPSDGALEHEVDPEIGAHLLEGLAGPVVLHRRGARGDRECLDASQPGGDLLGHAGGEVGVLLGAEVLEREHHDARAGAVGRPAPSDVAPPPRRRASQVPPARASTIAARPRATSQPIRRRVRGRPRRPVPPAVRKAGRPRSGRLGGRRPGRGPTGSGRPGLSRRSGRRCGPPPAGCRDRDQPRRAGGPRRSRGGCRRRSRGRRPGDR